MMHQCGCVVERRGGPVVDVLYIRPCERHRSNDAVQMALASLDQALYRAHVELPPMQIEQEERAASGERFR